VKHTSLVVAALTGLCFSAAEATLVLDFESPLPGSLAPMSYLQGTPVPASARVTDQYLDLGIVIDSAALVQLGSGHAASGLNGLGGIDGSGNLDYDTPVSFTFFLPGGGAPATINYFAYSPDLAGGSGNIITITAYDQVGSVVGQASFTESGSFPVSSPLSISGIGPFHRVTIDQTLFNTYSGGIGIDLVTYGDPLAVPEPATLALLGLGLAGLGFLRRRP
jgi:hypothetical protein